MKLIYNLSIYALQFYFFIGRFFSEKLKLGYNGRLNWREKLLEFKKNNPGKLVWFHCSSLGEFEMARPIIDEMNLKKMEDVKILITFFSPSGYEVRKNFKAVDGVMYLPFDSPKNAKDFVSIAKPHIAIFVKYEFWLNFLTEIKKQGSKLILINGLFRKNQTFFNWWGNIFKDTLGNFDHIFLQNKLSQKLLKTIEIENTSVTGDLRYDRVVANSSEVKTFPQLELFINDSFVLIGGSTWAEEEWILKQCLDSLGSVIKLIIVPHNVSEKHLRQIETRFQKSNLKRFSEMKANENPQIILVDEVGHLSSLYQFGHAVLVGGGFSGALHNIIEPAVFGIPVFFGYKHSKFPEAEYFRKNKIGISIHNGFNFTEHIKELLAKPEKWAGKKHKMPLAFKAHLGGTQQVYAKIKGYCSIHNI